MQGSKCYSKDEDKLHLQANGDIKITDDQQYTYQISHPSCTEYHTCNIQLTDWNHQVSQYTENVSNPNWKTVAN